MTTGEVVRIPIETEYKKNPDISPDDIKKLRQWLNTQPHLPGDYITDLDLLLGYHCCGRSAEVTKQVLDLHFTLRTLFTTYFKDRCFDKTTEQNLQSILYACLPTPSVNGYRVIYVRLLDPEPKNFHFPESIRTSMMILDLWQQEEGTFPGFVIMVDFDMSVIGHLTRVDLTTIRQVLYFLQEAMLLKMKEVHFLNAPGFMDKVMSLLKPFMNKQLLDMVHIHQVGSNTLEKFVKKETMPKECGGQYLSYNEIRDNLRKRLKNNSKYFEGENKKRVQESLRPGKKPPAVEIFGIEGSFKKLNID